MNKKVLIIGAVLVVAALALALVGKSMETPSYTTPAPSSSPNDPAVKGLNINN